MPPLSLARRRWLQTVGGSFVAGHSMSRVSFGNAPVNSASRADACIYIFLSGGLAQHESFDPKPDAPEEIRGEFKPIATRTSGLAICEHLPKLASTSHLWSICRSVTHPSNDHSAGHHIMLTGRTDLPRGFDPNRPSSSDYPSIATIVGHACPSSSGLPSSVVLPEKLIHFSGRVIPGQFAGQMGAHRNPWFIEASPYHATAYGAYPEYSFDHQQRGHKDKRDFCAPKLGAEVAMEERWAHRRAILENIDGASTLKELTDPTVFAQQREAAMALLSDAKVRGAFDVTQAHETLQDRYGRNSFGWSLLMARRLVQTGVRFVQVHLGNDETWDTHGEAFPHLKEKLLPPMDRAVSALLSDLEETAQLSRTLVIMAGEFGRTPKISHLRQHYKKPGRDHWGRVQSVLFAGGGIAGGRVVGASDKQGGFPADSPQTPEDMAATMYSLLGIPDTAVWHDATGRPNAIFHGRPIDGLL